MFMTVRWLRWNVYCYIPHVWETGDTNDNKNESVTSSDIDDRFSETIVNNNTEKNQIIILSLFNFKNSFSIYV